MFLELFFFFKLSCFLSRKLHGASKETESGYFCFHFKAIMIITTSKLFFIFLKYVPKKIICKEITARSKRMFKVFIKLFFTD